MIFSILESITWGSRCQYFYVVLFNDLTHSPGTMWIEFEILDSSRIQSAELDSFISQHEFFRYKPSRSYCILFSFLSFAICSFLSHRDYCNWDHKYSIRLKSGLCLGHANEYIWFHLNWSSSLLG